MPLETKDIISAALSSSALIISIVTFALNFRHTRKSAVFSGSQALCLGTHYLKLRFKLAEADILG